MEYNWTELKEYRAKEILEAVTLINDIWRSGKSPDYFAGVMALFNRIMLLPKSLCKKEELEFVENMVEQEFSQVSIDLLREAIRD